MLHTSENVAKRSGAPRALAVRALIVSGLFLSLTACKLVISVPQGGVVKTVSGSITCRAGQTCEIDVVDVFFDETFTAHAHKDHVFSGWKKKARSFCGDQKEDCALSTTWMGDYPKVMAILASNREFYLEPEFRVIPKITEQQIVADGEVSENGSGFDIRGKLSISTSSGSQLDFTGARLSLEFNSEGDLMAMHGVTNLPSPLAGFVTLEQDVRAEVGLYRGSEINADPEFEITLQDERQYFVFLVRQDMDINVANPVDPSSSQQWRIGTPASGKIILIVDPADEMVYRYGESAALGAYGRAESEQRLLPYKPWNTHTGFNSFDGNKYETISGNVGVKAVDVLKLSGSQVIYEPRFSDINWDNPLESNVAYKAGFNGAVDLSFGVAGFELFSFDIGRASALFNVNPDRGVMKLAATLAPDVSWQPDWFPIIPQAQLSVDFTAVSDGTMVHKVTGRYESVIPPADLEGSMRMDPRSVTYSGRLRGETYNLPVSIRFADFTTTATVGITADFSQAVTDGIDSGFDAAKREVAAGLAELEAALTDLEFEVSLRGVRQLIPGIVDGANSYLNGLPGRVAGIVHSEVIKQINNNRVCYIVACTPSDARRDQIARDASATARSQAQSEVTHYQSRLNNLKTLAQRADDESLRAGLEAALREVYANRVFKKTISVRVKVSGLFDKTFTETITEQVLAPDLAAKILTAADNMHNIPAASDRVVRGEQLVDSLPDPSIVDRIRKKINEGSFLPPTITGVFYKVRGTDYSAGATFSDGSELEVDFNVLDTGSAAEAFGNMLSDYLYELEKQRRP